MRPRITAAPGGLGSPSVPTKRDCLKWLDAARTKGGESCPDQGGRSPPVRARKLRPRGQKSRDGAPRGARAPDNGARQDGRLVRHRKSGLPDLRIKHARSRVDPRSSALHPLGILSGRRKGLPRAGGGRRRTRRRQEYGRSRMSIRSARPRESGDPVLDARLRGHERRRGNRGAQRQNETGRALPIRGMAIARPDDVAPRVICWRTTTVHAHDHDRHR